jgi:phosphatidylglycerol lysyltransferase
VFARIKSRALLIWTVTLVTLASGIVNLLSLIGPSPPRRLAILENLFPIELLHLSRFLTLIIGFALIVSSINIYKRKKRAFQIVLALLCLSVLFQLTKGLDYEEALICFTLIVFLLFVRKSFTVKSSIPNLSWGIVRLIVALIVAFGYGVAGFWLLDRKEFGVNFTIRDSIYKTFSYLTLVGHPELVPRTHYARWFLDSMYVISITAIAYSLFALYRPAIYKFSILPHERLAAKELAATYGRDSQDFFKLWPDKSFFFSTSSRCFLAYSVGASFAVALADPVGPEGEIEETIRNFLEFCKENDWRLAFHQTLPDYLFIYKRLGFKKLKIGEDAIVDLVHFTLEGKGMKEFRHVINKMEKSGIRTRVFEPPIDDKTISRLKDVSDEWLQIPGRRERTFTVGMFEPSYVKSTTIFAATDGDGNVLSFVNIIPSYRRGEATIDLMRRRLAVPNGIMDYLLLKLFAYNKEKGFERFSLGMAPMSGFREQEEASVEEKAIHYFVQHLNFIFSFTGLRQYKSKFATFWEPRYTMYRNHLDLPRLGIALGKVSEVKRRKWSMNR